MQPARAIPPDASVKRFLEPSALIPSEGIVKETALMLADSGVSAQTLIFEITESSAMSDPAACHLVGASGEHNFANAKIGRLRFRRHRFRSLQQI